MQSSAYYCHFFNVLSNAETSTTITPTNAVFSASNYQLVTGVVV